MRTLLFGIALASLVSCVKTNAFKCDGDSAACGANGQCETDGFCSIPSDRCGTGGREYSDTAGELSGKCVGGDPQPDGPPDDGPDPDGPEPDGPQGACPGDYVALASGNEGNHKYKFFTTSDTWSNQHNQKCVVDGAYLAIPDSAAELQGLFVLAGSTTIWVGVTDGPGNGNEGTFKDVLQNPYDAATKVGAAVAANNQGKDCVKTTNGTTLTADGCDLTFVAVCECDE